MNPDLQAHDTAEYIYILTEDTDRKLEILRAYKNRSVAFEVLDMMKRSEKAIEKSRFGIWRAQIFEPLSF